MECCDQARDDGGCARRVTVAGLVLNICLAAFKFVAGTLGHSQAVIADAVHSISDLTTDIAVLAGSYVWSRPPDAAHPYGHRRIETLVALFVGGFLALAGIGLGLNAMASFKTPPATAPHTIALAAALVSIITKELIFRWTRRCGRRTRSVALEANAQHHRSDALSSIPTALAVAGAMLVPSWVYLDAVAALVVCIFILHSAWRILWSGLREVSDSGAPPEAVARIEALAAETEGVREVHALRTRYVGARLQIDLHILVDGRMSVASGHAIAVTVRERLIRQGPDVLDVVVHIEPYDATHSRESD